MNRARLISVAVALGLLASGCESGGSGTTARIERTPVGSPTSQDTLVVGFVGTLSGPESWRGEDAFEGADLGVHILNRDLGPGDTPFELVGLDDGGDATRAGDLVAQLAASSRTVGIVYAGPLEGLPPAEGALAEAGIPAVLCYGDLYSARLLSPHVFQVSPPLLWQARRIASYLLRDRRYNTVGALIGRSLAGRAANTSLRAALTDIGGGLALAEGYAEDSASVAAALDALERKRVEAIVFQGPPSGLARLLKELRSRHALYRTTKAARVTASERRRSRAPRSWRPQVIGFDETAGLVDPDLAPAGLVASDSYARGAHYLPVPSLRDFHSAFVDWWGSEPLGWEQRAYEAVGIIGWAAETGRADPEAERSDLALTLESLQGRRFGGLEIEFGPDDHTAMDQPDIGLWVIPRAGEADRDRSQVPDTLPWVPLARGFSIDGRGTDIDASDWAYLFANPPPPRAPAPPYKRMLFGVTTTRSDPVH